MKHLYRKTKRLTIRPLESADFSEWKWAHESLGAKKNRWDREPKTHEQLTWAQFKKILTSQKRLREADQFYDLAVFENASQKFVGTVAVMDVLRGLGQSAYLGYFIHNPYWGLGFGQEATLAALDIGFRDVRLHRLEAGIEPRNRRSIRLARAIGLRKEGLKKRAVFLRGQWNDLVMYSATCEEFGVKWKGIPQPRPR